jgi:hypothetical protein
MKLNSKRSFQAIHLLLILLFAYCPQALSQDISNLTVSIRSINKPLHNILDDLTDQTGYFFTFDSRLIDSRQKISINITDISIQKAIDTLFHDPDLTYKVINKNIVVFPKKRINALKESDPNLFKKKLLEVNGVIKDLKSDKPLPYATISVLDTYFGTISNEDGCFLLRIPDTLQQTILVSSYIGYNNQYTPISLKSDDPVEITMNKNMISLQEVIIRYQDPIGLLTESLKRINSNYMNEPAGMQAYYREKVKKDEKCMIFSEAVVEIAKAPYTKSIASERTRLLKARKVTNIDIQDTVVIKLKSGISTLLQLDIIKNPPDFLSSDFILKYNLQFSNVVSFKDKLVYVISFQQKEEIQETLFRGDIYIERGSLAIIAADFEYDPSRIQREQDMFIAKKSNRIKVRPLSAIYHVEYKQTYGTYHLSLVTGELKFKVRKRRQWIASRYQINLEMAITNIDPGNPPEIRYNEQLKPATILSDQEFQYDPDFWGDYTTIAPETSLSDALKRIGKSMMEITSPSSISQ